MMHMYIMQSRTMDEDVVQVFGAEEVDAAIYGDKGTRKTTVSLKCQLLKVRWWGGCANG